MSLTGHLQVTAVAAAAPGTSFRIHSGLLSVSDLR